MERRTFLKWLIHGLNGIFAVVLGVPAVAYLMDPRHRVATTFRTVARLGDLKVGEPYAAVVRAAHPDVSTSPANVIGSVWLIRQPDDGVQAFTQICPHQDGPIVFERGRFLCPCHYATFAITGQRLAPVEDNPAPRDLDELRCQVVGPGPDAEVQVEYKKFIQGSAEKKERT